MQESIHVLHLITCHGRMMPPLAEILLAALYTLRDFAPMCISHNMDDVDS